MEDEFIIELAPPREIAQNEKWAYLNDRGEVAFWNPQTNTEEWIPEAKANEASASGLQPLSIEELQLKRHQIGLDAPGEAFTGAAISGLTLGLPEVTARMQGWDAGLQRRKELKEEHPGAYAAGDIAGTIGSGIVGPLGAIGAVGSGAAKSIAGKLIARSASEGAAVGAASEIVTQTLEDKFDPGKIAKDVIAGSILGGGLTSIGIKASKIGGKLSDGMFKKAGIDRLKHKSDLRKEEKLLDFIKNPSANEEAKKVAGELLQGVRKNISENRQKVFESVAKPLAIFRRNPLYGGVLGGFASNSVSGFFLGIIGSKIGSVLTSPTFIGAYARGAQKASRTFPYLGLMGRSGAVKILSDREFEESQETVKFQDSEQIGQDAFIGYTNAGLDEEFAKGMSNFETKRYSMVQQALSSNDRIKASKLFNALEDPRRITLRLNSGEATREDIYVLQNLFPEVYQELSNKASSLLEDKRLSPDARRQLELIISPSEGSAISRTIQQVFQIAEESPDPRGRTYDAATNMQRIQRG